MKKQFAKLIFLSYVHCDNRQLFPEQMGCITRLQCKLKALASTRLGRIVETLRYNNLQGNYVFSDQVVQQLE
jgi:hypothetical protein